MQTAKLFHLKKTKVLVTVVIIIIIIIIMMMIIIIIIIITTTIIIMIISAELGEDISKERVIALKEVTRWSPSFCHSSAKRHWEEMEKDYMH